MKLVVLFLIMAMSVYTVHGASEAIGEGLLALLDALGFGGWCTTHQCASRAFSGVRCVEWRRDCGCGKVSDKQWECICKRSEWGGGFGDCPKST